MTKTTEFLSLDCVSPPPNNYLNLFKVTYSRGGKALPWLLASRLKTPLAAKVMDNGAPIPLAALDADAVQVVAITDEEPRRLLLNDEFRIPLGTREVACPAGKLDKGEDPATAANRELQEEVGYQIKEVIAVSPPLFSSAGMTDETTATVIAIVEPHPDGASPELTEDIEPLFLTSQEAAELLSKHDTYMSAKSWPFIQLWAYCPEAIDSFV